MEHAGKRGCFGTKQEEIEWPSQFRGVFPTMHTPMTPTENIDFCKLEAIEVELEPLSAALVAIQ